MDKTQLVDSDLQAGRTIIERLESEGFQIDVAFWLQDEDTLDWRLVISSPMVRRDGPRPIYEALLRILGAMPVSGIQLEDVTVASPGENRIKDLKRRVGTNDGLHDIRLDSLTLGWTTYRSARIYRVSGGQIEYGARVRVKSTDRIGTVYGVVPTSEGPRYLVLYHQDAVQGAGEKPQPPVGAAHLADELEFLYVVKTAGWPDHLPSWLTEATGASLLIGTGGASPRDS